MLRALVLALLLANAAYFAWAQGLLTAYGLAPARQTEPERLARQIRPEALRLIEPDAPASQAAAPAAAAQCLQVGVFNEQQVQALRPRLQTGLPAGSWSFESSGEAGRWIIYMGKYVSKEAMNRKRLKLEQLGVSYEMPASARLHPGLSLGSFGSRTEAEQALDQLAQRGIRTARVVQEPPSAPNQWLRLPAADAAMRQQLDALKPQLADKALQACS